jgi:hypothetical protein
MAACAAAALLVSPSFASADGLATRRGLLVLGADRLFPLLSYTAISAGSGTTSSTQKNTSISLLGGIGLAQSFYNVPRLAFDYALTENVTIGGAVFAYITLSATQSSGSGTSSDLSKLTLVGVAPRMGYLLPLSSSVWLWPRAGITYDSLTSSPPTGSSSTINQFAANIDAMFVLSPVEHVGITLGPEVDVPISGSSSSGSGTSTDTSQFHVGLTAGLAVWF